MFIVDDTPEARKAEGQQVTVSEHPSGSIEILHDGVSLPYRFRDKMRRISQPVIADSKRLGHALQFAQALQESNPHHSQRNLQAPKNSKSQLFAEGEQIGPPALPDVSHDRKLRKVSPQRSFSYAGRRFVLVESVLSRAAIGDLVEIEERDNGEICARFGGEELPISHASRPKRQARGPMSQEEMKRILSTLPPLRD